MSDEHKANAVVDVISAVARQNPARATANSLKIVLEWIKDGGLTAIAQFIAAVAAISFASRIIPARRSSRRVGVE